MNKNTPSSVLSKRILPAKRGRKSRCCILMIFLFFGLPLCGQTPQQTAVAGGSGGSAFVDVYPQQSDVRIAEVQIRAGNRIDAVNVIYAFPDGRYSSNSWHGGQGGTLNSFKLDTDEYIVGISGRYGETIDSLRIQTNKRSSQLFGGPGGSRDYQIVVPQGNQAVGFMGRVGIYIDAIGLLYLPINQIQISQTPIAGGGGGSVFSDEKIPSGARISEVRIRAGDHIDAIQAIYLTTDGRTLEGAQHGGGSGRSISFTLSSDEYIIGLSGRFGDYIDSLRIQTNKRTSDVYGGRGGSRDFRINIPNGNRAVGFAGRAGDYLDAIGLTYAPTARNTQRPLWPLRNSSTGRR
jgi:Jacalin-like lectin domain